MNIIQPTFEIWTQEPGLLGMYKQIERAGRVCYKSENNATADSAQPFVERMMKSKHTAMLEHGTVYLTGKGLDRYRTNKFSQVRAIDDTDYVTTNLRVLFENGWMDDLQMFCEPTLHHATRITVHFTTQIAITREFNRHRANSMAEQSTRYCNYSKDKFSGEISINEPSWVGELNDKQTTVADFVALSAKVADGSATEYENWMFANMAAERSYMNLIAQGRKPQEARVVLPLDCNTELVHTAFVADWMHFFDLRALGTTGAPHPDAKVLALPLYEEFKRRGLV